MFENHETGKYVMTQEDEDVVRIVIDIFNEAFGSFDLPACIAIIDSDGLALVTAGLCPELGLFEGQMASIVTSFETLKAQFTTSFNDDLNLFTLEFENQAFYVDDLKTGAGLYLVAHSENNSLLLKARPFLANIVEKIEMMFNIQEGGDED